MMTDAKIDCTAKALAEAVRERGIDAVKLVVVLNGTQPGEERGAYVYAPGVSYSDLAEKMHDITPDDGPWHILVKPGTDRLRSAAEKCARIYECVKSQSNFGCLGIDFKVYYADVREVPVTATVTPQHGDGHGLPPGVSMVVKYRDDRTGMEFEVLKELVLLRRLQNARTVLGAYCNDGRHRLSQGLGGGVSSELGTSVVQALLDLAPQMMAIIEEHKLP